jgi:hypothetical protein
VVLPIIGQAMLYFNRQRLGQDSVVQKYGLLYEGYSIKYHYWEALVFARKILLTAVSIGLRTNMQVRTLFYFILYPLLNGMHDNIDYF